MGLSHAPRVITDGLVLGLDAANTRSYGGSGTTWTDLIGSNNGTLTNGPVFTQEPKLEPFGGAGAVYFDGNADRINIPASSDFNFGTGDFTVEWWQYLPSTPSEHLTLLSINYGTNPNLAIQGSGPTSTAYKVYFNGISTAVTEGSSCPLNQWVHYAVVRNGSGSNNVKIYRDGVQTGQGTYTGNAGNSSSTNYIGGDATNSSVDFEGYVSNLRILKGTALYTSNFTPPRKKLEATSDTVLLTCEKGTIKDRSSSAHAITVTGDAKSISGASYFEFDGTDDYIAINQFDHTATNTVEMWFKKNADVLYATPYAWGFLPSQRWQFSSGDENMNIYYHTNNGGTQVYEDSGINVTTLEGWVQIVVTADYNNDEYKTYKNGSLVQTGDLNNQDWSYVGSQSYNFIDICRNVNNNNGFMSGNVSVLRIYRKVLTASEIEQNFNALRGRYGI